MRRLASALGVAAVVGAWIVFSDSSVLALLGWSAYVGSPWVFLALGARSLTRRFYRIALGIVTAVAVLLYAAFITDDSSTGALVFVFMPLYQWLALGAITFVSVVAGGGSDAEGTGVRPLKN